MHGIGTLINCGAIILGSGIGMVVKGGLPKRFQDTIMHGVALAVLFIGLGGAVSGLLSAGDSGVISTQNTMLMVLSLVLGAVTGELIDLDTKLGKLGGWVKKKVPECLSGTTFVEGFVNASLLFCVGAMAVVGALEDGLSGDYSILAAKSVLDGITSVILGASRGEV